MTIHFVPSHETNAPWLKMPVPGLTTDDANKLAEYFADKLGWMTWYLDDGT